MTDLCGIIQTAAFAALSPWGDPDNDDWRDHAADQVRDAVLAALTDELPSTGSGVVDLTQPIVDALIRDSQIGQLTVELHWLRSAVWRIVNDVDDCNHVTTEGGDRFMLTDVEADAVRRALTANEPF